MHFGCHRCDTTKVKSVLYDPNIHGIENLEEDLNFNMLGYFCPPPTQFESKIEDATLTYPTPLGSIPMSCFFYNF